MKYFIIIVMAQKINIISKEIERTLPGINPENSDTNNNTPATNCKIANNIGIKSLLLPNNLFTDLPNSEIPEL